MATLNTYQSGLNLSGSVTRVQAQRATIIAGLFAVAIFAFALIKALVGALRVH